MSTTGTTPWYRPEPMPEEPKSWTQNPYLQLEGGFLAGLCLGAVPFAGTGQQLFDAANLLDHGTPEARLGLALGEIVGGILATGAGAAGEVGGGGLSLTGGGAVIGVPVIVGSTTVLAGGAANVAAGIRGLLSTGSGSGAEGSPHFSTVACKIPERPDHENFPNRRP